jgi:hypothetical protein
MPMVGSNTGDGAVEVPPSTKPSSSSPGLLRRLGLWTVAFCVGVAVLAAVGFLWFIWRVPCRPMKSRSTATPTVSSR